jgi:hypothetical protein
MLTEAKKQKLIENIKLYIKKFLSGSITDLDESGTRIMINHFLTDVLGYTALEEVRTEYMIKGTYADYMIQINGKRHFLVEVKAFSLNINESHLRQAVNYGANEGVEWALLTNGKQFDFYKIIFEKPIQHKKVFAVDLTDSSSLKAAYDIIEYLAKDSLNKGGLDALWNKAQAMTPTSISKQLLCPEVVAIVRKNVNKAYEMKFTDQQIQDTILKVIAEKIDLSGFKVPKLVKKENTPKKSPPPETNIITSVENPEV